MVHALIDEDTDCRVATFLVISLEALLGRHLVMACRHKVIGIFAAFADIHVGDYRIKSVMSACLLCLRMLRYG